MCVCACACACVCGGRGSPHTHTWISAGSGFKRVVALAFGSLTAGTGDQIVSPQTDMVSTSSESASQTCRPLGGAVEVRRENLLHIV